MKKTILKTVIAITLITSVSFTSCNKEKETTPEPIRETPTVNNSNIFELGHVTHIFKGQYDLYEKGSKLVSNIILDQNQLVLNLHFDNTDSRFILGITGNFRSAINTPTTYTLSNGSNDTFVYIFGQPDPTYKSAYYTATLTITEYNPLTGKLAGHINGQGDVLLVGSNEEADLLNGSGISLLEVDFNVDINQIIDNVDGSLSKTF